MASGTCSAGWRSTSDIDGVLEAVDQLDVLVNNAGQNFPGGKDEWDPEGYAAAVAVNMLGPMRLTMGCHDKLKASTAQGGASVVSIVSMSAFRSAVSVPGYGSSKAGMVALTRICPAGGSATASGSTPWHPA